MSVDTNTMVSNTQAIDFSKAEQEKLHQQKMYLQFRSALLNKIWRLMRNWQNDTIMQKIRDIVIFRWFYFNKK